MTTLRDILNLTSNGVTNIVLFRNGYDVQKMTVNEAFKEYKNILDVTVIFLEVFDENTIRIIV